MMPAMICAVPPNAMASGMTTGSPVAGNSPALMLFRRTVVTPKPISPKGAGFAMSAIDASQHLFCFLNPSGLRIASDATATSPLCADAQRGGGSELMLDLTPGHAISGMTLTASGQFQLQYDSEHRGHRRAKLADQLIDFH